MKIKYDRQTDILYIQFSDLSILESDEEKPGIILDYAENGEIVGIEILDTSQRMPQPIKLEYEVA